MDILSHLIAFKHTTASGFLSFKNESGLCDALCNCPSVTFQLFVHELHIEVLHNVSETVAVMDPRQQTAPFHSIRRCTIVVKYTAHDQ